MPLTKFLNPKNDYAFKRIFGRPQNQDILIHFLNDMLGFLGELNRFSWTEIELNTYEQEQKRELDAIAIREQQLTVGRAEGRLEEKREMAKKMIKRGVAIDIIAEDTDLTREELEVIKTTIGH